MELPEVDSSGNFKYTQYHFWIYVDHQLEELREHAEEIAGEDRAAQQAHMNVCVTEAFYSHLKISDALRSFFTKVMQEDIRKYKNGKAPRIPVAKRSDNSGWQNELQTTFMWQT